MKFYVTKKRIQDWNIEIEADDEEAAETIASTTPEEDWNDEGCETEYDVEEIEE